MPSATVSWYGRGVLHVATDTNWVNDPLKVVLVDATYQPDQDAHEFFAQVTGELATGNGYTQGGTPLLNKALIYDPASNQVRFIADPVNWIATPGGTIQARRAVIYKDTGTAATSPLLAWADFGSVASATADIFQVNFDTVAGIVRITAL